MKKTNEPAKASEPVWLKHYTSIYRVLQILENRCLFLGDTEKWEDKNDAVIMAKFRALKKADHVLAICFNAGEETIHHWRFFGQDLACRIDFDREFLPKKLNRRNFLQGAMQYLTIQDLRKIKTIPIDDLPFLKRKPYEIEQEFRIVYAGPEEDKTIKIKLEDIRRITITDKMPEPLFAHFKKFIHDQYGLKVYRTTITENRDWVYQFELKEYC
jgi:hypothetical protein